MWGKTNKAALHAGVISSLSFTGTGTDDLTVTGSPGFALSRSYKVVIDSTGETFKWSNDGGSTYEVTWIVIETRVPYELRNAEGELEGISLVFGSRVGHVNADFWTFTTTGTVVAASETVPGAGVVYNSRNSEGLLLHGQYVKGTEDGSRLKVYLLTRGASSSYANEISLPVALGDGGIRHKQEYFEMIATANYTYRVNLMGVGAFKVTQAKGGVPAATGLLTCFADLYKVER